MDAVQLKAFMSEENFDRQGVLQARPGGFLLAPSLFFIWKTLVFVERCVGEWCPNVSTWQHWIHRSSLQVRLARAAAPRAVVAWLAAARGRAAARSLALPAPRPARMAHAHARVQLGAETPHSFDETSTQKQPARI